MDQKEFGVYLAKLREKSGYKSQRQLALESGISSATLSRIESGTQKPTPETLWTLSVFLKNTPYDELMVKAGYITPDFQRQTNELRSAMLGKDVLKEREARYGVNESEELKEFMEILKALPEEEQKDVLERTRVYIMGLKAMRK